MIIVVALGGNAILRRGEGGTYYEQYRNVSNTCKKLVDIIQEGYTLIITHGNGPQVGATMIRYEAAKDIVPPFPLHVAGSETQGFIGYMIQQAMINELKKRNIKKTVSTIVTQVVVDKNDPAFKNPSKPIGPFYTKEEVEKIRKLHPDWVIIEDSGRGYRRVVPSPDPIRIVEIDAVKALVESGHIVITCGGGGIPVIETNEGYVGVDAVIDKDLASEKLASSLGTDIFMILTDVDGVYLNYGKPNAKLLKKVNLEEIKSYYEEGHFKEGSMKPKVLSVIRFIQSGGKHAVIGHLDNALKNLKGETGTHIYP